jgi:putative PIN family toxin of toxin-antitoxin system
MAIKTVIDTNVLVSALSSRSIYHWLILQLLDEKIDLSVTEEILLEYEEILKQKYSSSVAENFLTTLRELPKVHYTRVYYQWNLLKDEDDNKFVDCYIASNSNYLITNDSDFNSLKTLKFPLVNILSLQEFELELLKSKP